MREQRGPNKNNLLSFIDEGSPSRYASSKKQLPKLHQVKSQGLRFSNPDPQSKMFNAMKQRYTLKGIKKTNSDTLKMIHRRKIYSRATKLKKIQTIAAKRLKRNNNKHNRRMVYKDNDDGSNSILGNLQEYKRGGW